MTDLYEFLKRNEGERLGTGGSMITFSDTGVDRYDGDVPTDRQTTEDQVCMQLYGIHAEHVDPLNQRFAKRTLVDSASDSQS
jgi:hypothetical protein